jgi:extradiol dioxygenase family protein
MNAMAPAKSAVKAIRPFHLAFPVRDIEEARKFYGELLGCPEGRSSDTLVAHLAPEEVGYKKAGEVDGHDVPVKHFGVILTIPDWKALAERLKAAGIKFIIEPYVRFEGEVGEQHTMFFLDPSGNALEFKAFANDDMIFAK